jgi:hypothetical protein
MIETKIINVCEKNHSEIEKVSMLKQKMYIYMYQTTFLIQSFMNCSFIYFCVDTNLQMENTDESIVGGNDLSLGMNQILCENSSTIGMGPDYDLQQSNLALLKAELKV